MKLKYKFILYSFGLILSFLSLLAGRTSCEVVSQAGDHGLRSFPNKGNIGPKSGNHVPKLGNLNFLCALWVNVELEIDGLIDEGWKPRIKKRKKLRYITLRKGNQEKSLGPYTEELWEKVKPVDRWATPSQVSELERRMSAVEEKQRESKPSLDPLILKKIKELDKFQRGSNPSLLEKRIKQLEESQRGSNPDLDAFRLKRIIDLEKMREELIESAERRLSGDDTCKHINKNGFCLLYYFSYDEVEKSDYLRPMGHGNRNGKKIYYINVKEHPLVCSACPEYKSKS